MKVFDVWSGRLGNSIFRYMASSLFCIVYGAERVYTHILEHDIRETNEISIITDNKFKEWSNKMLSNTENSMDLNITKTYAFLGYFQLIDIYKKYRNELLKWFDDHPNDMLPTDSGIYEEHERTSKMCNIFVKQLTSPVEKPIYDIVFHIRLEDFIKHNMVVHPQNIESIIVSLLSEHNFSPEIHPLKICFVCNTPKMDIEHKYINYFVNKYNIIIESNDVITDYLIMKNAKTLICSNSTLSWCAAFLSTTMERVYFPSNNLNRDFTNPIENTIIYNSQLCGEREINEFVNR